MEYEIKQEEKFRFIEEGEGEPLVLLHGLFGELSNFSGQIETFRHTHKVVVPILPLLDLDLLHTTVSGLEKFLNKFIEHRDYKDINLRELLCAVPLVILAIILGLAPEFLVLQWMEPHVSFLVDSLVQVKM